MVLELPRSETFDYDGAYTAPRGGKIIVIMNPKSGRDDEDQVKTALSAYLDELPDGELRLVGADPIEKMAKDAVAENAATVIAVGGDGTISAVAEALAGSGTTLGVIPAGTFNYFARGLGIPEDLHGAIDVLRTGTARPAAFGRINGRLFLNNCSIGIYSMIRRQREEIYRRFGRSRAAAYWSVITAMLRLYRRMRLTITVDGTRHEMKSALVFVANSDYQIEEFGLEGSDALKHGNLAVYVSRDRGRWHMIKQAVRLVVTGMRKGRDFELFTGRDITIETDKPFRHVVRDGEIARMKAPFTISRDDTDLQVIVPSRDHAR
ncbi:diacylglycerol/lipid kinase family protein [Psychromarinibacter halotolerans]|uniref:Diacylglycerol/lipid kinase family protein n=1 Tax=Psychromarinibacter halotolerans TaxID=1775175 RepID=A0ABV7GUY9_9RHOB|nr:diacylglycerol kinase family protein [Psychromarinibacter halotolerans]MDF0594686.1 diacylglycerol kinase family protein [Psychromarinibacter halotolerans]